MNLLSDPLAVPGDFSGFSINPPGWTYRWMDGHQPVPAEEKNTPLLGDLNEKLLQDIVIQTPEMPGRYTLQLFLQVDNERIEVQHAAAGAEVK